MLGTATDGTWNYANETGDFHKTLPFRTRRRGDVVELDFGLYDLFYLHKNAE